tara:strand:- start:50 stop:451 length:402 start_codon:yes stop_codon:yes gene_type:complete
MAALNKDEIKECRKCHFVGSLWNREEDRWNFYKDGTTKKDGTPRVRNDCRSCFKGTRKSYEKKNRQWVQEYKEERCCEECGRVGAKYLVFHHPDDNKEFSIGNKAGRYAPPRLLAEIEKCTLLCALCHIDIHH